MNDLQELFQIVENGLNDCGINIESINNQIKGLPISSHDCETLDEYSNQLYAMYEKMKQLNKKYIGRTE